MKSLSRRRFIGRAASGAAAALTAGLPFDLRCLDSSSHPAETNGNVAILDLKEHCCLPESIVGYESALAHVSARAMRVEAGSVPVCAVLIVPAAGEIPPPALRAIRENLRAGAAVILESGAAFAELEGFQAHRDALSRHFHIEVGPPVALWSAPARSRGIPYVDYTWPHAAKVRDFSRVVPLTRQPGDVIARAGSLPVALRRHTHRGTLIFLGSPLGPALRTGDPDASRWLREAIATS